MTRSAVSRRAFVAAGLSLPLAALFALAGCASEPQQDGPAPQDDTPEQGKATPAGSDDSQATSDARPDGSATPADEASKEAPTVTTIDAATARQMMLEPGARYTVLDVREQSEYDEGHIEGAKLLPYGSITAESAAAILPAKDETVLVYCRSGRRSAIAAQALADLGYTAVYDFGGIIDWPYEVVTE